MKRVFSLVLLFFIALFVKAQDLEQVFNPLIKAKNMSYTDFILQKDFFSEKLFCDTVLAQFDYSGKNTLIKIREGTSEIRRDTNKLVFIDYKDNTYKIKEPNEFSGLIYNSFVERVKRLINDIPDSKTILPLKDSIVRGVPYHYYQYISYDSLKNGKRVYKSEIILVDKINLVPVFLRIDTEGFINGSDTHVVFFEEHWIDNLKIDDIDFKDISDMSIPSQIKLTVSKRRLPLEKGIAAPFLTFTNETGHEVEIEDFKGLMVLLNITWVGCPHSMQSISMLNGLQQKFADDGLKIISIYPLDDEDNVLKMNQKFDVKYGFFKNSSGTKNELDKYNIDGYPTFYLIGANGKIIKGWTGYSKEISKEIDALISNNILL